MQERIELEAVIEEFESLSMDAGRVQRETLQKILEENGGSEYLSKWGLNGRTDPESYKACVPIVTHRDIEPYIRRIADAPNGENSSIITTKPIPYISMSSGTSEGKAKYLPFNHELVENTMQVYKTSFAFRSREYPVGNGKALQFVYGGKHFNTEGGLNVGTSVTHLLRSAAFKETLKATQRPCCSPDEVIFGGDYHQSLYCHLLCGLIFRHEIQIISSTFAHTIVRAFRTFENIWPHLVSDIRHGHLSPTITSASVRSAMAGILHPNPGLVDELSRKFSTPANNWYGLIPELFPNVKYIYGIMTGSMEPYINKLRHYAGDVPLVSADYGATEGWIGVNVKPKSPPEAATFAVLPTVGYFEFVPLDPDDRRHVIGLTEVEIWKEYEIVLTSFAGLYRYRLGDVVRVAGFYNGTPELQFVRRRNAVLSVNIDKNTEKDLQLSVEAAAEVLAAAGEGVEVVDYTSCVDTSSEPAHYVVFWETSGGGGASDGVMEECCNCLDRTFEDEGYVSMRRIDGIGALELRVVRSGTFQKIMDHLVGFGGRVNQFKTPRCVGPTNGEVMKILCDNVVKTYFSSAY